MKNHSRNIHLFLAAIAAVLLGGTAFGQEKKAEEPAATARKPSPQPGGEKKATPEELEAVFKTTLTKATLAGRWCSIKDGELGPEKEDQYTIVSVTKLSADAWLINAKIKYNQKEFVAPIPVQVKWAGDTPVLIVDKLPLPGGVYSARVLIYEHTYVGTWSAGDHGGLLKGVITNAKSDKPSETK
jgi:hypothetical protein